MWEIFTKLLGLYTDFFKEYPLAAAITTLLFVLGYFAWTKYNEQKRIRPTAVWEKPAFLLFIGWCILTPVLGFIFDAISTIKEVLFTVAGLYGQVFKLNPAAAAIVTVALLAVYFLWRFVLNKWAKNAGGLWAFPGTVLLVAWLIITPIVGLIIKPHEPTTSKPDAKEQPRAKSTATPADKK